MAIVFLPLNGIGWGHLSRAHALAEWLRDRGHAPVIFAQGHYPDFMASSIPGVSVGTVYEASLPQRRQIRLDLIAYARLTTPSIVIEDTHPAPISLPADLSRVLLVRPLSIAELRRLRQLHESSHRSFLIVDHPDSPTWPFSKNETDEIHGWPRWFSIGPIYREASRDGVDQIRLKYSITPDRRVYVFSMGAGGVQPGGRGEHESFCKRALSFAENIRSKDSTSRFLFVRGGLFPSEFRLPPLFEDIAVEPRLPDLIAAASGAVIRPTYNAIWECIGGRTPFMPIIGRTHHEPVEQRIARLREHELLAEDFTQWHDRRWVQGFEARCALLAQRWSLAKAADQLYRSAIAVNTTAVAPRSFAPEVQRGAKSIAGFPLAIRIHAASEITDELLQALMDCASRGLKVSLDVIPYLCRMDEAALRTATGDRVSLEIAQHGYTGLPRHTGSGRTTEFVDARQSEKDLQLGIQILRRHFPTMFHGGLSAPFDSVPDFLPEVWSAVGGRYISGRDAPQKQRLPIVRLTLDPWHWRAKAPFGLTAILTSARRAVYDRGYAGLIVDARRLRSPREVVWLSRVIDRLVENGGRPAFISELAHR